MNLKIIENKNQIEFNSNKILDTVVCCNNEFCIYYDEDGKLHNIESYELIQSLEQLNSHTSTENLFIIVQENLLYRYINNEYIECTNKDLVLNTSNNNLFKKTILSDNDQEIAPVTFTSSIIANDNTNMEKLMNNLGTSLLCKTIVKTNIVMANKMNQTIFKIPYPFLDYLLGYNNMTIIIDNVPISNDNYEVDGDYLRLKNISVSINNYVLFIFSYTQIIDQNDIIVNSKNITNGCITNKHLSNDILLSADNIKTNDNKQFISKDQINTFNNKADKDLASSNNNGLMSMYIYKDIITLKSQVQSLLKNKPTIISGTSVIYTNEVCKYIDDENIRSDMTAFANIVTDEDGNKYNCNLNLECVDGRLIVTPNEVPIKDIYFNWCIVKQANIEE